MALNPYLNDLVNRSRYAARSWQEQVHELSADLIEHEAAVSRLRAELEAAKAEVKATRLEVRLLKAEQVRQQTANELRYAEWMHDQEGEEKAA